MGRLSTNLDAFAKASVENEICPFCEHPLPVGVTECKCGARLDLGGVDMDRDKRVRSSIIFTNILLLVISYFLATNHRMDWWAWMVPLGIGTFLCMFWPRMENSWHRDGQVGLRKIWINE